MDVDIDPQLLEKAKETIHETSIKGLLVVERKTFPDGRGFFRETYRMNELEAVLSNQYSKPFRFNIVQQNHSRNESKGTLRGIHRAPWNKFIYVPRGVVQSVVVDLREDSATFGKYESFVIGEDRLAKIFVPAGCGNAYLVLSDEADFLYDVDDYWYPNSEEGILWSDDDLKIDWQLNGLGPNLSEKDKANPLARELFSAKFNR
jgi:dTDP-4-dehydrorhamnose 3,5-epimerase